MTSQQALTWRRAAVLFLAASAAIAGQATPGLPNFQKVNFKSLADLGVKTVVDLREIGEHSQAEEQRMVEADGMRYVSVPFKGMSAPTSEQISQVLGLLDDNSTAPVFVHCRRGADRTGTVIACYRIAHDRWQNGQALIEAKQYGMSMFERAMQHYVQGFVASVATVAATVQSNATPLAVETK
jgi:protein tyrosine/serine phosphatase